MNSGITIREATAADAAVTIPLLLETGKQLLIDIFGLGDAQVAEKYLRYAWLRGEGQYGYKNHWVADDSGVAVGLVTCWHSRLPEDFDRKTLETITDHYGLDKAIDVVMASQQYMATMAPPLATELAVGHLAVCDSHRGMGIGKRLLCFMYEKARQLKKNALVLNAELENQQALGFYRKFGFSEQERVPPFVHLIKPVMLSGNG